MVKVIQQSLLDVAEMSFKPGDPFPNEQEKREGIVMSIFSVILLIFLSVLGKIYENVLFFGDVLLRMPDITKKVGLVLLAVSQIHLTCTDLQAIPGQVESSLGGINSVLQCHKRIVQGTICHSVALGMDIIVCV